MVAPAAAAFNNSEEKGGEKDSRWPAADTALNTDRPRGTRRDRIEDRLEGEGVRQRVLWKQLHAHRAKVMIE